MKNSLLLLAVAWMFAPWCLAQSPAAALNGTWIGVAQTRGQAVPFRLELRVRGDAVVGAFVNAGVRSPATRGTFTDGRLRLDFDDYLNHIDATLDGDVLTGTFGGHARTVALTAHRVNRIPPAPIALPGPDIAGNWEIAVPSRPKGEPAWQLQVSQDKASVSAVILRIDGDTGRLYGAWNGAAFQLSKFNSDGPATLELTPQPDGTLQVRQRASGPPLIARRPSQARAAGLAGPDDPLQHTRMLDPAQPLAFRFPDLDGHVVANTDAAFRGHVLIVSIGGSWCPNCHDEAPFLESLYRKYHSRGLDVVELSFEEPTQLSDPTQLRAFIREYGITYPVLLAGSVDDLNKKLPGVADLNCWPTTFFVGRDGLVKSIHAGYAGPATAENASLRREVNQLLGVLLAQR